MTAGPAWAQRATGPFQDLFGGDHDSARVKESGQTLDLRGSAFGAFEDDTVPPVPIPSDPSSVLTVLNPRVQTSSMSEGLNGSVSYLRRSDRVRFQLNGGSMIFGYTANPNPVQAVYNADTGLSTNLGRKTVFDLGSAFSYSPFYQIASFPGAGGPGAILQAPGYQLAAIAQRNTSINGTMALTSNYTKRSSLSVDVSGRDWRFLDSPSNDVTMWGAHGRFQHRVTRALGFHLGYGQDEARYTFETGSPVLNQTIDVGLDYGDTLSFARRTALSFSTSTSATRFNQETHYRLNGTAMLTRGLGRTWSTWLGYVRATDFAAGFRAPLLSDSVSVGLGGQLASRLKWSSSAGLTRSAIGFSTPSDVFTTYMGTSKLDLAMTRLLAVYGQYTYYRYQVPNGSTALQLSPTFARQAVTFGFSMWVPIINAKGRHDSR